MRHRTTSILAAGLMAAMSACASDEGAASSAGSPCTSGHEAAETAPAPASTVTCHLECSGTESSASAATEVEARAVLTGRVRETCRPEDGQYFIVCDPPR